MQSSITWWKNRDFTNPAGYSDYQYDENLVFLLWRAHMIVRNGPHDVVAIKVGSEADLTLAETT